MRPGGAESSFSIRTQTEIKQVVKILSMPAPNFTHPEFVLISLEGATVQFPHLFGLEFPKFRALKVAGVESWPEIVGVLSSKSHAHNR